MRSSQTQAATRTDKVRAARQTLDQHIQALAEQMAQGKSEQLVRYLEFTAQFHSYSFGNVMLILCQRPNATRVAGLRQWNRLGRHVRAGEKGIMILAPMTVRKRVEEETENPGAEEDSGDGERITLFKPVYVFDVSQTDGEPLPELLHSTGDASTCYPALEKAVRTACIALEHVEFIPGAPSADGVSRGGSIAIRSDLDQPEAFRTLAHEFAHELLHWPKDGTSETSRGVGKEPNRTVRETEADAAAFVVCRHFGITCDSSDYLLLYDAESKLLLDRLETVRQTAARIIEAVENEMSASGAEAAAGSDGEEAAIQ